MNPIHIGVIFGQSLVAVVGLVLGVSLVQKWSKTHNRPTLHFAVYFLGCTGYFLRALIDFGYGNGEVFSRVLYLVGMTALYVGVLPGVLVLLPSPGMVRKTVYKVVPPVVFVVVLLAAALAPTEKTELGLYVFKQPYHLIFVRMLHGLAGFFAIVALIYLYFKIKDVRPAAMGVGFTFILIGAILMGTHEVGMAVVGSVLQGIGLVMFYLALVVLSQP